MAHITILGTGNMGQAIAGVITAGGSTVQQLGGSDTDTPVTGEIVILAVPYPALAEVLATRGDSFAGRVVVDITNPRTSRRSTRSTVPADSSAAAEIEAELPTPGCSRRSTPRSPRRWRRVPKDGELPPPC